MRDCHDVGSVPFTCIIAFNSVDCPSGVGKPEVNFTTACATVLTCRLPNSPVLSMPSTLSLMAQANRPARFVGQQNWPTQKKLLASFPTNRAGWLTSAIYWRPEKGTTTSPAPAFSPTDVFDFMRPLRDSSWLDRDLPEDPPCFASFALSGGRGDTISRESGKVHRGPLGDSSWPLEDCILTADSPCFSFSPSLRRA